MSVQDHLCSARIPTPVLTGLLIPASLLIILAIVPPHAFDLSVSKLFFSDGWPWHRNEVFTTIFYRLPKLVPAIVATVLLVRLAVVLAQGRRILEEEASRRALYVVIAMGACAAAVWWLKSTTGVACPWSVEPFGGALPMTDPAFGLTDVPGRCWPSGHAGTGFVFIAFYFALKDVRPRAAAGALLFAVAFGLLCGAVRVMEGAHFVSHVLVTGIVDWLICAALHALILENRSSPALAKPLSERGLVLLTAFWWTFVLNMPFLARAADLSEPNFAWSMREALTLAGLSFGLLFISIALLTLVMALPRPVRRAVLVLLSLTGAIFFAGTLVYGIAFDPNMARNVISTDVHEASAYFSARTLLLALAAGLPPVLAASAADMTPAGLRPAAVRGGVAILALAAGAGALFTQMNTHHARQRPLQPRRHARKGRLARCGPKAHRRSEARVLRQAQPSRRPSRRHRRDHPLGELGARRLRPRHHARASRRRRDQPSVRHGLRLEHRRFASLHAEQDRPLRLRPQPHHRRGGSAVAPRPCGRARRLGRQPERLQGHVCGHRGAKPRPEERRLRLGPVL